MALTDENGDAYFSFKVLKGLDGALISIICECEDTKTPLSNPIWIDN